MFVPTRPRHLLALLWATLFIACGRRDAKITREAAAGASSESTQTQSCFEIVSKDNSPSARAVFAAKRCQGGGVTWAGILRVLIDRRGTSKPVELATPGWTGDVRILSVAGRPTRVAIDDEADAALFCADSARLVNDIRGDIRRLNAEPTELERAMAAADPLALECFPSGTSVESLLKSLTPPPPPSPAEADARKTGLIRVREALTKQRTWCWRKSGAEFGGEGGFTLHSDGQVSAFSATGTDTGSGRWTFEDDGRIEVVGSAGALGLHHFDVGASGNLGFNHTAGREELDPCARPVLPG
ncbi:MAG TPA: hypothetical protein VFK05_14600 [Polyangiaceae bacterium]|nr:hypothetical protein [Polyangiaceae bacterium]